MDINPLSSGTGLAYAANPFEPIKLKPKISEVPGPSAAMSEAVAVVKSQENRDSLAVQGGKGKSGGKGNKPRFEQDLTGILRGFPTVQDRYGVEGRPRVPGTAYFDIESFIDTVNKSPLTTELKKSIDENFLKNDFCKADKKGKVRHEISPDGKSIRAVDGYAAGMRNYSLDTRAVTPPPVLYHGTVVANLASIQKNGVLGMQRQYVSLTSDKRLAQDMAKRHDKGDPSSHRLLEVSAQALSDEKKQGFYNVGKSWQTKSVPPEYFKVIDWEDGKAAT